VFAEGLRENTFVQKPPLHSVKKPDRRFRVGVRRLRFSVEVLQQFERPGAPAEVTSPSLARSVQGHAAIAPPAEGSSVWGRAILGKILRGMTGVSHQVSREDEPLMHLFPVRLFPDLPAASVS
jgi:hypothetical protein